MNRNEFMAFFRDDECLNQLTVDDRMEIFSTILVGSTDFNKALFDQILIDYEVENLHIDESDNIKK